MILALEFQKIRRTGYLPIFFCGGLLAAVVPVVNMAARANSFTGLAGSPFHILMDANWQLMAQLTILLIVCGCSLMYNTEYADRGDLKMSTLPIRPYSMFFGKFGITLICTALVLAIQTVSMIMCSLYWFPDRAIDMEQILQETGYELVLFLPSLMLMLAAASVCKNMWISLGAGVILTFLGSMLPADPFILTLAPFATPYRMLHTILESDIRTYLAVCSAETLLPGIAEIIHLRIRRTLS